jgi:hypothetical protein
MLKNLVFVAIILLAVSNLGFAQTVKIAEYYQLNGGNSWNYTAPPSWNGDYVSRMETGDKIDFDLNDRAISDNSILHYDATNAAKILLFVKKQGIYYFGENFADKTSVRFDMPLLWFPEKLKIGQESKLETGLTRFLADGKTVRGTYRMTQKIVKFEDMTVTAGTFKKALRIESETFWDLGDGRKARSINIYHYAKNVGVIKASARFIIINAEGKEVINRLVETDLKSYQVRK